jgi:hypothetical protein
MADKHRDNTQPFGESVAGSKLTEDDVLLILQSPLSNAELARQYGMAHTCIGNIRLGKSWSWLTGIQYHLAS